MQLDRWGLRRHEVELVYEPNKVRNKRIYTESEYDELHAPNEAGKPRCKRINLKTFHDTPEQKSQKPEARHFSHEQNDLNITSGNIKRRRDTIEKNLDEMFGTGQAAIEPPAKRNKKEQEESSHQKINVQMPPSPIMEPFYGFQEQESNQVGNVEAVETLTTNRKSNNICPPSIPSLSVNLPQVDLNGNTFGMSSVFASPISDFDSDFDCDDENEAPKSRHQPSWTKSARYVLFA